LNFGIVILTTCLARRYDRTEDVSTKVRDMETNSNNPPIVDVSQATDAVAKEGES
jgi:hypothetical protein